MRRVILALFTTVAASAPAVGCTAYTTEPEGPSLRTAADPEREQAAQAAQGDMHRFARDRQTYIDRAEDDLNHLAAEIASFKADAPVNEPERASHQAQVDVLEQNLEEARGLLDELRYASANEWRDAQQDVEEAILTARTSYDVTVGRLAH